MDHDVIELSVQMRIGDGPTSRAWRYTATIAIADVGLPGAKETIEWTLERMERRLDDRVRFWLAQQQAPAAVTP